MAAKPVLVTVGTTATLVFEFIDRTTYAGLTSPAANILLSGTPNDPVPIMVILPGSGTVYFGGSGVTTGTGVGIAASTMPYFFYNDVGGDSLYAVVSSSTAVVSILAFRQ